jgi:DNA-binding NarL/FixJ family response regulator
MFAMGFARIVLVEDQAILREGLRALIELEPGPLRCWLHQAP